MDYLKVWVTFKDTISMLTDEEKGRLFDSMLQYAKTGEEPIEFIGNERFLWVAAKQDIDRTEQRCLALKSNASKGGIASSKSKQSQAKASKVKQTVANSNKGVANSSKLKQNVANPSSHSNSNIYNNIYINNIENELFDKFWLVYPRHVNKQAAKKAFEKINPNEELLGIMLNAIEKQKQSAQWNENGGQYIPHPATWLNGHRWEDEVMPGTQSVQKKVVVAQDYTQRDYADEDEEAFNRMLQTLGG